MQDLERMYSLGRQFSDLIVGGGTAPRSPAHSDHLVLKLPYWDEAAHRLTDGSQLQSGDNLCTTNGELVTVAASRNCEAHSQIAF
ncbi:hypothetical protein ACIPLC_33275 [Kitasatospora sp. NPDC086801]|uniref:hypothetical protein n=1 Tax=Kitasatospora sp. NPDC086801 TaxID=3364066 RepID=UPI003800FBCD